MSRASRRLRWCCFRTSGLDACSAVVGTHPHRAPRSAVLQPGVDAPQVRTLHGPRATLRSNERAFASAMCSGSHPPALEPRIAAWRLRLRSAGDRSTPGSWLAPGERGRHERRPPCSFAAAERVGFRVMELALESHGLRKVFGIGGPPSGSRRFRAPFDCPKRSRAASSLHELSLCLPNPVEWIGWTESI